MRRAVPEALGNAATAVKDKQIVALFVMEDSRGRHQVSDMVRGRPESAKSIVDGEVMVVTPPPARRRRRGRPPSRRL